MTIRAKDVRPSRKALRQARELARRAAREDTWMLPCPEDHVDESGDIGDISQAHRDGWEETGHFETFYGRMLSAITDSEEERIVGSIGGLDHLDLARYEGLYVPLKDAFWDEWEELTKFYEKAQAAIDESKK